MPRKPDQKILDGYPAREAEIADATQAPAADHLIKQRIAKMKDALVDKLTRDGDDDDISSVLSYADGIRALSEAPLAREVQQKRLRTKRIELQKYRDEHLEHFYGDALAAEREIVGPIQEIALAAIDNVLANLPQNLKRIDRLRPVSLDGVSVGLNASLSGDLAALRDQLAAIEVMWPRDVNRETGAARNFAAEKQAASRERWDRSAQIAAERHERRAG